MHDVAEQRRCRLVPVGREVEVDIAGPDLGVIPSRRATGHEAVAEVDEAAERHEGEEDGLLEAHAVGAAGFLLEDARLAHLRAEAEVRLLEKNRLAKVTALELSPGPELAVLDRHGAFAADLGARRDDRLRAVYPASRMDGDPVPRNPFDVHLVADVDGQGVGQAHTLLEQTADLVLQCRPEFHFSGLHG